MKATQGRLKKRSLLAGGHYIQVPIIHVLMRNTGQWKHKLWSFYTGDR